MEQWLVILMVVLSAATFLMVIGLLVFRAPRGETLAPRIESLEDQITQQLSNLAATSAERLERVRGDLRQDLSDRISTGLQGVKAGVEQQLNAGRHEQDNRLRETVKRLEEKFDALNDRQTRGLSEARQELSRTLGDATKALETKFVTLDARVSGSLEAVRSQVETKLSAVGEQVQQKLDQNIKDGFAQFEKVQQHLKAAEEQLRDVGKLGVSIGDLNNLLKLPHLRGRFGEASLERILTDFLPAHMFEIQTAAVEGAPNRPDAIIRFPDRILPIDSKFPREQVLPLFESGDAEQLAEARVALSRVIREQARSIATYIEPEKGTADVALMFLPSETLWYEVVRERELSAALAELRVLPVSPNTLLLAVQTIALTHKWYQVAAGFEKTREELGLAQSHFRNFRAKFEEIGKGLDKAQEAYSKATRHLGHYQSRVVRLTGEGSEDADDSTSAPPPQVTSQATAPAELAFEYPP